MRQFILIGLLTLLVGSAQAVVVEDFEGAWGGAGTLVADPDDAGNTVLKLVLNENAAIAFPGLAGVITMDIYDFGATKHDDGVPNTDTDYGPRWGVAGDDAGEATSSAATIINKEFLSCRQGYGYGTEISRTSSWWSPAFYSGLPRQVDSLQVIGDGTATNPETPGDGKWTTWSFTVGVDGSVLIGVASDPDTVSTTGLGVLKEVWFSAGRSHATVGEMATHGVLIDNVDMVVTVGWTPGDANGDGTVDLQDFGLLKDNFGTTSGAVWAEGDFNGDGAVDLQDFGLLKDNFGTGGAAVPEPATLSLIAIGGLALLRSRRK